MKSRILPALALGALGLLPITGQELSLREQAKTSLRRGVEFFRTKVAVEGSYLWQYSEDLSKREGEGVATATQGWVQPPGTPAVGMAILAAYSATHDDYYLEAARDTAYALVRGQLRSGGWTYSIDFAPAARKRMAYREGGKETARNVTTLDDDTTQSALRFLLRADKALGFKDPRIHESVQYAINSILQAQYPNGSWPQGYDHFPKPEKHPVLKASYPETWSRTWPGSQQYWYRYTLNDNLLEDLVKTLFEVEETCNAPDAGGTLGELGQRARAAAEKAGHFLILAQMPEPQRAWAQQYDFDMHPAWARKFEPPAVTGGESQGVMRLLLQLYRHTGNRKYLAPLPSALDYFRRSRLPDGRLARFYELRTNRPLYFTRDYALTFDDRDVPTHYSFKVSDGTMAIAREYERLSKPGTDAKPSSSPDRRRISTGGSSVADQVKAILAAQDDQGRWVENGELRYHRPKTGVIRVIRSDTFIGNVETLSKYLRAGAE